MKQVLIGFLILISFFTVFCWGSNKVKLKDVSTLTLQQGRMTTGRRSPPVPQLKCIGGSAGCSVVQPSTVQCYNRGFDGSDVQWECNAEMDSRYKFGNTEVVCEGYDYPDDPYILKGSCGLEYTLDRKSSSSSYDSYYSPSVKKSSTMGNLIMLAIIAIIVYVIYKSCLSTYQYSTTQGDYPDDSRRSFFGRFSAPPPPYPETNYFPGGGAGCSSQQSYGGGGTSGTTRFFQGMFTGGAMGYLFGNRNQGSGSYRPYNRDDYNSGGYTSNTSRSNTSSGSPTYTSTGYANTRRR